MTKPWVTYTVDANGCWIWPTLDPDGYGRIRREGKTWAAHRYFYTQANGPIPAGLEVDHLCFVPACVNPGHLRLLTPLENARNQRKAYKTHCIHGHEYTPENTCRRINRRNPDGPMHRFCRECNRLRGRRERPSSSTHGDEASDGPEEPCIAPADLDWFADRAAERDERWRDGAA